MGLNVINSMVEDGWERYYSNKNTVLLTEKYNDGEQNTYVRSPGNIKYWYYILNMILDYSSCNIKTSLYLLL